jgi:tetratricopeptide (TPR) repeat protein
MSQGDDDGPDYLGEPPSGRFPEPPVAAAALQLLPFDQMPLWKDFEELCVRLARKEPDTVHVQKYGIGGQAQDGIDIYARKESGRYRTYQCKRYASLTPSDISRAVTRFLKGEWAQKSDCFVFCVSQPVDKTNLAKEVEKQATRLQEQTPSVEFVVWDTEQLSAKLKEEPELVREFFGESILDRFLPGAAGDDVRSQLRGIEQGVRSQTRVVVVRWATDFLAEEIEQFAKEDSEGYVRLVDQVGNPPIPEHVAATIATPPYWLASDGDLRTWRMLAAFAERDALWGEASAAWEKAAQILGGVDAADLLVAAAITAKVAGDNDRHDALFERAKTIGPDRARVKLQEIDDDGEPNAVLAALEPLHTDDRAVAALIAARKALACLLIPDLERAAAFVDEAKALNPDSAAVQGIEVNVVVQRARLAITAGQAANASELQKAHTDALAVRDKLLKQSRAHEASRLLMLAVDSLGMLAEFRRAEQLLQQATVAELEVADAPEVLGDAALRVLAFREALKLTDNAPPTDGIRRIRADAHLNLGWPNERDDALSTLDELLRAGGAEADYAAFSRLVASVDATDIPWSTEAADLLRQRGFDRQVTTSQAFYLGRAHKWDKAIALLEPHEGQAWSAIAELRLAWMRKKSDWLLSSAKKVLQFGPSSSVRLECGRALYFAGDLPLAKQVLLGVAREPDGGVGVRANAYALLVRLVGESEQNWEEAFDLHKDWVRVRPSDPRASAWAPTVASRRLAQRNTSA